MVSNLGIQGSLGSGSTPFAGCALKTLGGLLGRAASPERVSSQTSTCGSGRGEAKSQALVGVTAAS